MSTESNKSLVRRVFEAINQRKLQVFDDIVAPSYVNHDMPTPSPGPAGLQQVMAMFTDAFPDLHIELDDVIAEGKKVATRGHWTGTHKGVFMGVPATGKKVNVKFMDVWLIEQDKATENWVQMDLLGLMQQLGVVPGPG